MKIRSVFSIIAGLQGVTCVLASPAFAEFPQIKLEIPQSENRTRQMGTSVSVDGDTMIVGASKTEQDGLFNAGSVLVYGADGLGGWSFEAEITASDPADGDFFGRSVALSGNTIIAGAPQDDDSGRSSGSAYVFTRVEGVWTEEAKLTASDAATGAVFGWSVALSGDTAIVGAQGDDDGNPDAGSAYVFTRSDEVWTEQAKLTAPDGGREDYFGFSVALSEDTAIVGAYGEDDSDTNSGAAYVFSRSEEAWTQQAKLTPSEPAANDSFGISVALSGNTAIVGAFGDDHAGTYAGSAYIFQRTGEDWNQQAMLTPTDGAAGDYFGRTVSLSGDTAIAGAFGDRDSGVLSGSAYVFTRSGEEWNQLAKLIASDVQAEDHFGLAVATDGRRVMVGAPFKDDPEFDSGAAYVFNLEIPAESDGLITY